MAEQIFEDPNIRPSPSTFRKKVQCLFLFFPDNFEIPGSDNVIQQRRNLWPYTFSNNRQQSP